MLVFLQSICCIIGIIQTYTCNFLHAQSLSEPKLILKIYKEIVLNLKKIVDYIVLNNQNLIQRLPYKLCQTLF